MAMKTIENVSPDLKKTKTQRKIFEFLYGLIYNDLVKLI